MKLVDLRRLHAEYYARYAEYPTRLLISYDDYYDLIEDANFVSYVDYDLKTEVGETTIMGMHVEKVSDGEASVL